MGLFDAFRRGLARTATSVSRALSGVFAGTKSWTDADFERFENALVAADFGVPASLALSRELRARYQEGKIATEAALFEEAAKLVAESLQKVVRPVRRAEPGTPTVILMVGVNGSGKTTSIGKLAQRFHAAGGKVMLAAADTFRAAAVEQLQLWGTRVGVPVIAGAANADPASVAFDAASAAKARGMEWLLIDTAGRQHTKKSLMDELAKIFRSVAKACPGAPHEVWLTLDAGTGSNALNQAREFSKIVPLSGLILTKLDGTSKGGMAVAVCRELALPTFFAGFGEAPEDLREFDPESYARALFAGAEAVPETAAGAVPETAAGAEG